MTKIGHVREQWWGTQDKPRKSIEEPQKQITGYEGGNVVKEQCLISWLKNKQNPGEISELKGKK